MNSDREIIVSERTYKAASVFTTMISIAMVFVGFMVIDEGINWPTGVNTNPILVVLGLSIILSAGGLYVFSLRFKTVEEVNQDGR
ncbi:MAG: LPXTG cell wall anchor domain-containing protein [Halobacteria archaeon]